MTLFFPPPCQHSSISAVRSVSAPSTYTRSPAAVVRAVELSMHTLSVGAAWCSSGSVRRVTRRRIGAEMAEDKVDDLGRRMAR